MRGDAHGGADVWVSPGSDPVLGAGEVHVWRARVAADDPRPPRWWRWLDDEERRRAERIRVEPAGAAFVAGRGLLRWRLGTCLGLDPREIVLRIGEHGKPELESSGNRASGPAVGFNVSHSGDHVLVALGFAHRVGVDIESPRAIPNPEALARRYFSESENDALRRLDADERRLAFHRAWTRKEAYAKALGLGLQVSLASFDVSLEEKDARLLAIRDSVEDPSSWTLRSLETGDETIAALAVDTREVELRCFAAPAD